jgi:signal transduction histidine kinase
VVRVPQATAYLTAQDLVRQLVWLGFALVVTAALIGIMVARRLSRPLEKLSAAADVVGAGQFDVAVDVSSRDEVGVLAQSFNTMTANLRERDEKLKSRRKLDDPAALAANLDVIERETRRCTEIIGSLMRFSRQEPTQLAATDVNDVVARAVAIVDHQLSLKNVTIETDYEGGLPFVHGNANQLQQVLMNLMINAQQAMEPKGGSVRIRTWRTDASVLIAVRDSGPGIAPEHVARIFEPFFTTKQAGQGTGLGLSVTYGIVRDHSGEITVSSEPGRGAEFLIRLPARADLGASAGAAAETGSEAA